MENQEKTMYCLLSGGAANAPTTMPAAAPKPAGDDEKRRTALRGEDDANDGVCMVMLLFVLVACGVFLVAPYTAAGQRMAAVMTGSEESFSKVASDAAALHPRPGKSPIKPFEMLHFRPDDPSYAMEGAAVVHEGKAYLTAKPSADGQGVVAAKHSVGRLSHIRQLPVAPRPGSSVVSSFRTSFIFSIDFSAGSRASVGDGLAFFMMPAGAAAGSAGKNMGVIGNSESESSHTFAVEFDTWKNPSLGDISCNHVGINVNSMVSLKAANAGFWKKSEMGADRFHHFDLTRRSVRAWIEYEGDSQVLSVSVSTDLESKPERPLMRENVDLSGVLEEFMMVGFSAGTGEFAAKHVIHSWEIDGDLAGYFETESGPVVKEQQQPEFWNGGHRRSMRIPRSRYMNLQRQASGGAFPEVEEATPICDWMVKPSSEARFSMVEALKSVPGKLREFVSVSLSKSSNGFEETRDEWNWNRFWYLMAVLISLYLLFAFICHCVLGYSMGSSSSAGGLGEVAKEQRQQGYVLIVSEPPWEESEDEDGVGSRNGPTEWNHAAEGFPGGGRL